MPAEQISLERAMQFIKGGFSYRLDKRGPVWQPSFTNHRIRDWEDYERHREYIRMNPVRARLSSTPEAYPYCSAAGVLQMDAVPPGLSPSSMKMPDAALKAPLFHGAVSLSGRIQSIDEALAPFRTRRDQYECGNRRES